MLRALALLSLLVGTIALAADPVPLDKIPAGETYKGQTGGLYGEGRNAPPEAIATRAAAESAKVSPIGGKIGIVSIGMSNTHVKFSAFMQLVGRQRDINPAVALVDGAQGGRDAVEWSHPGKSRRPNAPSPWEVLDKRLEQAGVKPEQVQVIWLLQARAGPQRLGDFPAHADALADDITVIVDQARKRFTNLRLIYLSSRSYAGYAQGQLNPEPYAYESAFSVRKVILAQKPDQPGPVILWGPYIWRDSTFYDRSDYRADGTHPSAQGADKIAKMMLEFFRNDSYAKKWFNAAN